MKPMKRISLFVFAACLSIQGSAGAATIPVACEATKQKETGLLARCLHKAEAKFVLTADAAARTEAIAKCESKFATKWSAAENKAVVKGGLCQTVGDQSDVGGYVDEHLACLTGALESGDASCLSCGNGLLDAGEDCDFGQDGAGTCGSETGGANPIGVPGCAPGCVYDASNCGSCASEGGVHVGPACWFAGTFGASCQTTCIGEGLEYDEATRTFAGSDGNLANCQAVLTAMGHMGATMDFPGTGLGCVIAPGTSGRDTGPTTATASNGVIRRMCACH
jgi:hypothetical protein